MRSSPLPARSAATWIVSLLVVGLSIACAGMTDDPGPSPLRKTLGAASVAVLEGADRGEAFLIEGEPSRDPKRRVIRGYAVRDRRDIDAEFARRVAKVLLSGRVTEGIKKCGIEPGVAFRIRKGAEAVDVLLCFRCDVLQALPGQGEVYVDTLALQDFDPARADLLKLAKEAFPDHPEIRAIPEIRKP